MATNKLKKGDTVELSLVKIKTKKERSSQLTLKTTQQSLKALI